MPHGSLSQFRQPPPKTTLWRYLSLPKFLSLLQSSSLYMARLDTFPDAYEGVWPENTVTAAHAEGAGKVSLLENAIAFRNRLFVNCWSMGDSESALFWGSYAKNDGVAIRSTVEGIRVATAHSIEPFNLWISEVKYVDFDERRPMHVTSLPPVVTKRRQFAGENEVRLITAHPKRRDPPFDPQQQPEGILLSVRLDVLMHEVVASPSSDGFLVDAIKGIVQHYGVDPSVVRRSALYDPPPPHVLQPRLLVQP